MSDTIMIGPVQCLVLHGVYRTASPKSIARIAEELSMQSAGDKRAIYRALHGLAQKDLVQKRSAGKGHVVYHVTRRGLNVLNGLMAEGLQRPVPRTRTNIR